MNQENEQQLEWRDTYFILFGRADRPTREQVKLAITEAARRITLERLKADEGGFFDSVVVQAPEDNTALEISYEEGSAVIEQSAELAKGVQDDAEAGQLAQLLRADARLDIMHFERVTEIPFGEEEEEWGGEAVDPTSLLAIIDALVQLTDGLAIDPASGAIVT